MKRIKMFCLKNMIFYRTGCCLCLFVVIIWQISCTSQDTATESLLTIDITIQPTTKISLDQDLPTKTATAVINSDTEEFAPESTVTPLPTVTELAIPSATPALPPILESASSRITSPRNFMLFTSTNILWHPDEPRSTDPLRNMTFSSQPWSPDGFDLAMIMRTQDIPKRNILAILNLPTGEVTYLESSEDIELKLSTSAPFWAPIWSPDRQFLTLAISSEEEPHQFIIIIYDLESQEEIYLSDPVKLIDLSGWSFDSSEVAYIRWSDNSANATTILETIKIGDFSTTQFTTEVGLTLEKASWSPTSKQLIAFSSQLSPEDRRALPTYGYEEIYLIDKESETFSQLKSLSERSSYYNDNNLGGYYISSSPWSPSGDSIIYSDRGLICTFTLSTNEESCVSKIIQTAILEAGALGGEYPSWSPSGEYIGFILKKESLQCSPLAIIDLESEEVHFTNANVGDCAVFGPIWAPPK